METYAKNNENDKEEGTNELEKFTSFATVGLKSFSQLIFNKGSRTSEKYKSSGNGGFYFSRTARFNILSNN